MPDPVDTVVCAPDDGWRYHPKHVEQFPDINKLCNVASCWIFIVRRIMKYVQVTKKGLNTPTLTTAEDLVARLF